MSDRIMILICAVCMLSAHLLAAIALGGCTTGPSRRYPIVRPICPVTQEVPDVRR